MIAKKGSKEWKAKVSKAQKKAWKKRRLAHTGTTKASMRGPKWQAQSIPREVEEIEVTPMFPPNSDRDVLRAWINSAPSTEERAKRKAATLGIMYGGSAQSLCNRPKVAEEDKAAGFGLPAAEKPFNPDEFLNLNTATASNPKTLTGNRKVPVLSVVPPASIIAQATAMRYGAYFAPKVDGTRGYGPYNWRDQPIEAHIYIDAAMRHLMQWWDGDEYELIRDDEGRVIDEVSHLAFAIATLGVLIDAQANRTMIEDRPKVRKMAASDLLAAHKMPNYENQK